MLFSLDRSPFLKKILAHSLQKNFKWSHGFLSPLGRQFHFLSEGPWRCIVFPKLLLWKNEVEGCCFFFISKWQCGPHVSLGVCIDLVFYFPSCHRRLASSTVSSEEFFLRWRLPIFVIRRTMIGGSVSFLKEFQYIVFSRMSFFFGWLTIPHPEELFLF